VRGGERPEKGLAGRRGRLWRSSFAEYTLDEKSNLPFLLGDLFLRRPHVRTEDFLESGP
jgi:hypothetical protein